MPSMSSVGPRHSRHIALIFLTMDQREFREALDALGMSQVDFSRLIAADARTVRRYALGETPVPGAVALLLRMLLARPELKAVAWEVSND